MPKGVLKSSILLIGTLGMAEAPEEQVLVPQAQAARATPGESGINLVLNKWVTAWRGKDLDGMSACLHPDLAKAILGWNELSRPEALQRVVGVQALLGKTVQSDLAQVDIRILDRQGHSASVRMDLGPWTAFIHLAAHRDGWGIANVLWDWRGEVIEPSGPVEGAESGATDEAMGVWRPV